MFRFIYYLVFFLVLEGLILHYNLHLPFISAWLGKLPGDLIIRNNEIAYYMPIASAALASMIVTIFKYVLSSPPDTKKKKK